MKNFVVAAVAALGVALPATAQAGNCGVAAVQAVTYAAPAAVVAPVAFNAYHTQSLVVAPSAPLVAVQGQVVAQVAGHAYQAQQIAVAPQKVVVKEKVVVQEVRQAQAQQVFKGGHKAAAVQAAPQAVQSAGAGAGNVQQIQQITINNGRRGIFRGR